MHRSCLASFPWKGWLSNHEIQKRNADSQRRREKQGGVFIVSLPGAVIASRFEFKAAKQSSNNGVNTRQCSRQNQNAGKEKQTCNRVSLRLRVSVFFLFFSILTTNVNALPTFDSVKSQHKVSEAWLLDRNGERLHTLRLDNSVRRLPWVKLDALSPAMQEALIASEDKRFYEHGGVDWKAALGAVWDRLLTDSNRGASTLSMQLAAQLDPKLSRGADGRSYTQKWDQMLAARELEKNWSKPQILEAYLNTVQFRGELAGINAASWGLFQKHPSGLNKSEASLLSALLRGPNAAPDKVAERACDVAKKLSSPRPSCKGITALAWSSLVVHPRIPFHNQIAPHVARQLLKQPGQIVMTSLDANLQRFALRTLQQHLSEL